MKNLKLKALGKTGAKYSGLETFEAPKHVKRITCTSDEVSALCPVTGQPDWYVVEITYEPRKKAVESKTLKLFLQSFRNQGHFCEDFSRIIAEELNRVLDPHQIWVNVTQKPRGGVSIKSSAHIGSSLQME